MLPFLFLVLYSLSFLTTGLWLGLKVLKRHWLPKEFLYIGALAFSLTIYYAIFYLYLLSPAFASIVVKLILLLTVAVFTDFWKNFRKSNELFAVVRKFFLAPLLIIGIVMFVYSTFFYSCVSKPPAVIIFGVVDNATFCHSSVLPPDNQLSFIFGNNILNNQDKKQVGDWNMVDRPPLEISATLPILGLTSHNSEIFKYFSYYQFAIFLQLSWIAAFWGAFQTLRINKKFQTLAFIALAGTGFFYINSVFVWPKLLAGSLVFTGILILLDVNKQPRYRYLPLSALLISLGILSHSAVLFTVIPFCLYYLFKIIRYKKIRLKYVGAALMIGLLMLTPWLLYKDSVVKSDRLAKWFFAGVTSASDKRGTVTTIADQYKKLSFGKWVSNKEHGAESLVTGNHYGLDSKCTVSVHGIVNKCIFLQWRALTFYSTFFAFELLGLGWIYVIYKFIRKKTDTLDKELLLLIFGGLAFWVFAMFDAQWMIVHAGSYATMMLAFFLLVKKLSELPRFFIRSIAIAQVILFYLAWITPYFKLG